MTHHVAGTRHTDKSSRKYSKSQGAIIHFHRHPLSIESLCQNDLRFSLLVVVPFFLVIYYHTTKHIRSCHYPCQSTSFLHTLLQHAPHFTANLGDSTIRIVRDAVVIWIYSTTVKADIYFKEL
jgi:hypothetical protein